MNLETQVRQVRARISEPYRSDQTDNRITDLEIVDWIHQAEIQILRDITEREVMTQTITFDATSGTELYNIDYTAFSGTTDGPGSDTVTIDGDTGGSAVNDAYNGMNIKITSGPRRGEVRLITDYVGATNDITVDRAYATVIQGSVTYDIGFFPDDILDITRVTYNGVECVRHPVHELGALDSNTLYRAEKGFNQYYYILFDRLGKIKMGIRPVPDDTSDIVVTYVKRPARRYKHIRGTSTASSATTIDDTNNLTHPDDWWNGAEIRITSGIMTGEERTVTDFDGTTNDQLTVDAFSADPGTGTNYDLGEVSDLPEEFSPMTVTWAAYIGFVKQKDDGQAAATRSEYESYISKYNSRYGFSRVEPARDPTANTL